MPTYFYRCLQCGFDWSVYLPPDTGAEITPCARCGGKVEILGIRYYPQEEEPASCAA